MPIEQLRIVLQLARWFFLATVVGIFSGSASALFLRSLDWVTSWREEHPWVIALLPLAGVAMASVYHFYGKSVESGNNLILDEIHDPKATIPLRMTPMILLATLITHLFGGSAGREGTAVQMGGSLADQLSGPFKLAPSHRRILLMAGMSAGFASVFGTPLAGALFGLEVLWVGKMSYEALFPCLIAAIIGNQVTQAWGIHHSVYNVGQVPSLTPVGLGLALIAGAIFGLAGGGFAALSHTIHHRATQLANRLIGARQSYWFRPMMGGILIALTAMAFDATRYIGLGLPVIAESFEKPVPPWDFAFKALFTAVTLGTGFKGGEVTPLFFIGSTLGNALSHWIALPLKLLAGMGFVAVFAGAANVPLTCTLMGVELFGGAPGLYIALACVMSYLFSGHAGIYRSQRIEKKKHAP